MSSIGPETIIAMVMVISLILYALLGGADYGAGFWDLFATGPRAEAQRDLIAKAMAPVWEANHVWLILVVVLLFSAFPPVFAAVTTALHLPLTLMLFGIVLRGTAFTFRHYDASAERRRTWSRAFAIPSVITPVLLGSVIGTLATGRVAAQEGDVMPPWLRPFPIVIGLFALGIFAYLAAVYLILETDDAGLREIFRRKALGAAVAVGVLAYLVYWLSFRHAPVVAEGLHASVWGFPVRVATGILAVLALAMLYLRHYLLARYCAMVQIALVLWGCALAQYPYLVPPDLTVQTAAAPAITLHLLLLALGSGALLLFPSLFYLFRVFKGHTFRVQKAGEGT